MKTDNLNSFEQSVLKGLENCGVDLTSIENNRQAIGVAVSGGADSVSLLLALNSILKNTKIPLEVITVNHFIREKSETCGDESFVVELCNKLKSENNQLSCSVYRLKEGEVQAFASREKTGIEDAARKLRYNFFEDFINKENIDILCLAHNKNDQLETLLMRFLQGASVEASGGIPYRREKFVRPLLDVFRNQIEEYLREKNQDWRTDSTNSDTNYLRNKIRNKLVPLLNEEFNGWQTGVLSGAEKNELDKELIQSLSSSFMMDCIKRADEVEIDRKKFGELADGLKSRVLIKALNILGEGSRIPFSFLKDVIECEKLSDNQFIKAFDKWEIIVKKEKLFVKKQVKKQTELYFSAIIEDSNLNSWIEMPFGWMFVSKVENQSDSEINILFSKSSSGDEKIGEVSFSGTLPLRIRNTSLGDKILDSSGNYRKIADIFSDWHVPGEKKELIPVVEELIKKDNSIVCILGSLFGFKDWMVK